MTNESLRCPACNSEAVVRIVYGSPSLALFEASERGEVVLGGCVIAPDSPSHQCRTCKHEFGRRRASQR